MSSHNIVKRILALIVFGLLIGSSAWGQQFAIQKADYGHGHLRVDVAQQLRELARSNTTVR